MKHKRIEDWRRKGDFILGYNLIETTVGTYIRDHYNKAVEVGFGGKTVAAKILQESGVSILCTDLHAYPETMIPSVVDDVFIPTLDLYRGADVIYAIRPGTEILPPLIALAQKIKADLIVYHLGFELYEYGGERIFVGDILLHRYVKSGYVQ